VSRCAPATTPTRRPNGTAAHGNRGDSRIAGVRVGAAPEQLLRPVVEIELAAPVDRLHSGLLGGVERLAMGYKLRRA